MKNLYQNEVTEYVVNCELQAEETFSWWIEYAIKKRKRIIGIIPINIGYVYKKYKRNNEDREGKQQQSLDGCNQIRD